VITLDLRGKVCPYSTTEVYKSLQTLPPGGRIEVLSDFAPARQTVPSLAEDFNCSCELREGEGGVFTLVIDKPSDPSSKGG